LENKKKNKHIHHQIYLLHPYIHLSELKNSFHKLKLGGASNVVEIASNDGYLLQYFLEKKIPVLGIEPTKNTAKVAVEKGIETITKFFYNDLAEELVKEGKKADLIIGNNVLAHNPRLNDFVKGMKILLKDNGTITMEFPHLYQLIAQNQFDTIYHEHYSYFSFTTVKKVFEKQGLEIYDVEEIPTHGGSLRIYAKHKGDVSKEISENISKLLEKEDQAGMNNLEYYNGFQKKVEKVKYDLLEFLIDQKKKGKKIAAYGAAAKGNTLLNYCGIKNDIIDFVVDDSPHKQGKFLPGSHIPIASQEEFKRFKPDYIIILPWNIKEPLCKKLSYVREWGCKFVIPIPTVDILE